MFSQVVAPFLLVYGLVLAGGVATVWWAHRRRTQAHEDEKAMSEAACTAEVEALLRGLSR